MFCRYVALPLLWCLAGISGLWAEPNDAARVRALIEQLGSDTFTDRQQAFEALDALGESALDALRQATNHEDTEIRKRARDLVSRIEKRTENARLLRPTLVQLAYKDTPLREAMADFQRQSGVRLTLHDPDNQLKDRKLTLNTNKTTFWNALAQFCEAAELHEGDANRAGMPAGAVARNLPARIAPVPGVAVPVGNTAVAVQPGEIVLLPGKSPKVPTDDTTSARIRPADRKRFALPASDSTFGLVLEIALEPRFRCQGIQSIRIDSAIDDKEQQLTQVPDAPANGPVAGRVVVLPAGGMALPAVARIGGKFFFPPSANGVQHFAAVQFHKAEKESKSLKQLSGTVTAEILDTPTRVLEIKDVVNATGKSVKADGGSLEILSVEKKDEAIKIRLAFTQPTSYLPETNPVAVPQPVKRVPAAKQLAPAAKPGAVPAAQPVPAAGKPAAANPVADKKPAVPVPAPALQIQQVQVNGGVIIINGGVVINQQAGLNRAPWGLSLQDSKGNVLPAEFQIDPQQGVRRVGVVNRGREYVVTYRPTKEPTDPIQLVFTGRKAAVINIPFKLTDVELK
jgi:hypothetical protein